MPSHKTHDIITIICTVIIAPITIYFIGNNLYSYIILGSFIFAGLMFNGDLDIYSRPYNRWLFFKFIWLPYRRMFEHRSVNNCFIF